MRMVLKTTCVLALALVGAMGCSDDDATPSGTDAAVADSAVASDTGPGVDSSVATDAGPGSDSGPPGDGAVASDGGVRPQDYAGAWIGTWTNTTFSSTGSASLTISVDTGESTAEMELDLNGNVFGGADPAAVTFSGPYTASALTVSGTNALFGPTTFTFSSSGAITGMATPAASADVNTVEFTGTGTPTAINIAYTIRTSASAVFATGTLTFTRPAA